MTRIALVALVVAAFAGHAVADVVTGTPNDSIPPGASTYSSLYFSPIFLGDGRSPHPAASPIVLPVKPINGDGGLMDPLTKARAFVAQLTLPELFVSPRPFSSRALLTRLGRRTSQLAPDS